ncbi:hypothetical protein H2200_009962 [Cladophialophora chaetospira]|uniref:BTB domain-containing protein n=1 Tax=Cladophialophora chaetospira TaxID=386627 RepID=A0AA38X231_9EURO|nr:hypothetical protein H2200_009962 [Cladophialophora chaetospira]
MSTKRDLIFDPSGDVLLVLASGNEESSAAEDDNETTSVIEEVEALVSSRHLALASRVFRIMFDGQFKERVELNSKKVKRVPLPDDDAQAMTILLYIVHGLNMRVPKEVSMEEFIAISILIDKTSFMRQQRWSTIEKILLCLQKTVDRYLTDTQQCRNDSKNCDTLVLGDIIKKLNANTLYPVPDAAPPELSVNALLADLGGIQYTSLCQIQNRSYYGTPSCNITTTFRAQLAQLESTVTGLNLTKFVSSTKRKHDYPDTSPKRKLRNKRAASTD